MALQQEGWGATGSLITSTIHIVASKIKGAQFEKDESWSSSTNNGLGASAIVWAVTGGAKMTMQTRNTSANLIVDALVDFAASIVWTKMSVEI